MTYAQITIGSYTPSESGAILQLKDDGTYSNGENAKKGLGMPKVELQDLNKLKMGPTATDLTATGADAHIGLLVYNVNSCAPTPVPQGLYVWSGTKWEFIGEKISPDVSYFEDNRPQKLGAQTYPYRTFGAAGTWMLENMRYLPNDNSITLNLGDKNPNSKYYAYPNQTAIETIPSTWYEAQGLLYTHSAATLSTLDNINSDQGVKNTTSSPGALEIEHTGLVGTAPHKYVEGICPPGWHIPSDREWNTLEEEIYNNAQKYSYYTETDTKDISKWNPSLWDSTWNNLYNVKRGSSGNSGHAQAMKSPCQVPGATTSTGGKSLPSELGGFDAVYVGFIGTGNPMAYGKGIYLWASSLLSDTGDYARYLEYKPTVFETAYWKYYLLSVRCKKN